MALYGYARASTLDQNLGIPHPALKEAGCDRRIGLRIKPMLHDANALD